MERLREGDVRGALDRLVETDPFPVVTGRVCPAFCEAECNRGGYDEQVSIRAVMRFLGDEKAREGGDRGPGAKRPHGGILPEEGGRGRRGLRQGG